MISDYGDQNNSKKELNASSCSFKSQTVVSKNDFDLTKNKLKLKNQGTFAIRLKKKRLSSTESRLSEF